MGHCNREFAPNFFFKLFPFLKYFISTPMKIQQTFLTAKNPNVALTLVIEIAHS
jgi:hypothetical protein